jgi:hypothetical protein
MQIKKKYFPHSPSYFLIFPSFLFLSFYSSYSHTHSSSHLIILKGSCTSCLNSNSFNKIFETDRDWLLKAAMSGIVNDYAKYFIQYLDGILMEMLYILYRISCLRNCISYVHLEQSSINNFEAISCYVISCLPLHTFIDCRFQGSVLLVDIRKP